jgi:hypothetical protein
MAASTLTFCVIIASLLHSPLPRIHDEFSYLLLGDTLAQGRISNPAPPLPEFFDTFHVLVHPVYASKYFPAQGVFLAIGERFTGHPIFGVWLTSALACAAMVWILKAFLGEQWALLGGFLFAVQYGIFSYWSQSYWGGMIPALGGALFFGALRRLWGESSWRNAVWLGSGLIVLASSRPLEGALAVLPAAGLFLYHLWRDNHWRESAFWTRFVLPLLALVIPAIFALGAYNRAITGSAVKSPYMLHEEQYQESPPLLFLPQRPQITYSSYWLGFYYDVHEMQPYLQQRNIKLWPLAVGRKIATWWDFYCGILLSIPLFVPGLLQAGKTRVWQVIFLTGLAIVPLISGNAIAWRILIDLIFVIGIGILWFVFRDFWLRLAIATCTLVLFSSFLTKWFFPHYFAPAACLLLYLQVDGLRRIWAWKSEASSPEGALSRTERRRLAREAKNHRTAGLNLRWVVYAVSIGCVLWLVIRVAGRLEGWRDDPHGLDRGTLLMDDWSLDRANLDKWLEAQPKPQLVFVRYSQNHHNVIFEWVYNHPDIMHSHVMWARDLGAEHNKLLLNLVPDRTVWLIEADRKHPQLIPYAETINQAPQPAMPQRSGPPADQD